MKKITKKNNKGFSLVELIVVVLIMAIIAVSLAPQVMKWVDRSRQANDASNYDALVAAAQLSVLVQAAPEDKDITITMSKNADIAIACADTTAETNFKNAMLKNLPSYASIRITSTSVGDSETYQITIDGTEIKRNDPPATISAD